ncbi:MAG: efflux RND transporter periplasmic adaptor subunit [Planctomycetota bacterium]
MSFLTRTTFAGSRKRTLHELVYDFLSGTGCLTYNKLKPEPWCVRARTLPATGAAMIKKYWIPAAVVVAAIVVIWLTAGSFGSRIPVDVARARMGPIREFVDEQAKTRLPETHLVTMPISGRIEPITLVEGDRVRQGQVVARLVERDLQLAVEEARAAVERLDASIAENANVSVERTGKQQALQFVQSMSAAVEAAGERVKSGLAKYDYSEKQLGRVQRLAKTGAEAQAELDRATLEMLQSGFDLQQDRLVQAAMTAMQAATNLLPTMIEQYIERREMNGNVLRQQKAEAQARLQQVLQDLNRGTMTSPVDGVVLARHVTNERFLSAGTLLLEIGQLEQMEVEAELLTLDAVEVNVGDRVEIYGPAVGETPARATVRRIYPAGFTKVSSLGVEQQRVMVIIGIEPNEVTRLVEQRGVGVGYRVRARIITAEQSGALTIPRSALLRSNDGRWQVFLVREGEARLQPVEVGLMNDELVEIRGGLGEGDLVVTAPEATLVDGAAVDAAAEPPLEDRGVERDEGAAVGGAE